MFFGSWGVPANANDKLTDRVPEREMGQGGTQARVKGNTACIPFADGHIPRTHTTIHLSRAPVKPFSISRLECRDCVPICCLNLYPEPTLCVAASARR